MTNELPTIDLADLEQATGGVDLQTALTPDHAFNDGSFLTQALKTGMEQKHAPRASAPSRHLKRTFGGWCDDGMGIVPCR